jgi:hypothetical protein
VTLSLRLSKLKGDKIMFLSSNKERLPKNITYNGIQEGISFNLLLFTEKTTGGTFAIREKEGKRITAKLITDKSQEMIKTFKGKGFKEPRQGKGEENENNC